MIQIQLSFIKLDVENICENAALFMNCFVLENSSL